METNSFYTHVSNWIKSYRNADALEWLRRFVSNSYQPAYIKQKLQQEIDWQIAGIKSKPRFSVVHNDLYLVDSDGLPEIFTNQLNAVCRATELRLKGYEVQLMQDGNYYRIRLVHPAPVTPIASHGH